MNAILAILKQAGGWHHGLYLKIENQVQNASNIFPDGLRSGHAIPGDPRGNENSAFAWTACGGAHGRLSGDGCFDSRLPG